jgi:hypothetical protein
MQKPIGEGPCWRWNTPNYVKNYIKGGYTCPTQIKRNKAKNNRKSRKITKSYQFVFQRSANHQEVDVPSNTPQLQQEKQNHKQTITAKTNPPHITSTNIQNPYTTRHNTYISDKRFYNNPAS